MSELIYPDLSYIRKAHVNLRIHTERKNSAQVYKLMGILFRVHRKLGNSYQEKYYQRAIETELQNANVTYVRESLIRLAYDGKNIGKYFLDFVIDEKIALEVKTVPIIKLDYINQVLAYLDAANLKLGIIANFRSTRLTYKRLVNPKVKI